MITIVKLSLLSIMLILVNADCNYSAKFLVFDIENLENTNNMIASDTTGKTYRINENLNVKSNGSDYGKVDWLSKSKLAIKIFKQDQKASEVSQVKEGVKTSESNKFYVGEKKILIKLNEYIGNSVAPAIYACGQFDDNKNYYIIMERMGKNILQYVQDDTFDTSFSHKLELFYKVFEAIDELHTQEVAHCNINLHSIAVKDEPLDVKLFYFDHAVIDEIQGLETPFFGAPEIVNYFIAKKKGIYNEMSKINKLEMCKTSDVFSTGMLLLELNKELITKAPSWELSPYSLNDKINIDDSTFESENTARTEFITKLGTEVAEVIEKVSGSSKVWPFRYILGKALHKLLLKAVNIIPINDLQVIHCK